MIEIDVTKGLGAFTLQARFDAPFAGVLGVMGASGSGKSTLLACLAGHLRPDAGRIVVAGTVLFDRRRRIDLPPARRGVGLVFQDGLLFPHMNVRRNLLYGARDRAPASFARLCEVLALGALLDRRPGHLSGGERQRVAIGRALLAAPRLLLLDEPLAALDQPRKAEILGLLRDVSALTATPMIYVSHSRAEIDRLAQHTVTLADGRTTGPRGRGEQRTAMAASPQVPAVDLGRGIRPATTLQGRGGAGGFGAPARHLGDPSSG